MRGDGWQRVDLTGLSVSDAGANSLLCSSLRRCGLATDAEVELPLRARLDWSRVDRTSAAGLAFFSTVVRELMSRERSYEIIDPSDNRLACLIDENWANLGISGERVPTSRASFSGPRVDCLAAMKLARGSSGPSDFLDACVGAFSQHNAVADIDLCMGCVQELIANSLGHSTSPHVAAVLLRFPARRPVVVEVGIADCGPGVAATVLRQDRHRGFASFSDASVLDGVFHHAFSGRPAEEGGGAFGLLFSQVAQCPATELVIRSGRGWLSTARDAQGFRKSSFNWGIGTQVSLTLKASR